MMGIVMPMRVRKMATTQDQIVEVPFVVHDATELHGLARRLWIVDNGGEEGVDAALGPIGKPDLRACLREVVQCAGLGVTFSFA